MIERTMTYMTEFKSLLTQLVCICTSKSICWYLQSHFCLEEKNKLLKLDVAIGCDLLNSTDLA